MVCDSCINAFADEGMGAEDVEFLAPDLGADIGDHDCDARGTTDVKCSCSCPKGYTAPLPPLPGQPEPGKIYRLTGGPGDKALSNGNSWTESEVK